MILLINYFVLIVFASYTEQIDPNNYDTYRVLVSYLNQNLSLECPDTGLPYAENVNLPHYFLFWVDEKGQNDKKDEDLQVENNLLEPEKEARYRFILKNRINDLSCGYIYKNKYVRIKKWKLSYVEDANIELKTQIDNSSISLNAYNNSFNSIEYLKSNEILSNLTQSGDIFKLQCENNFDMPLRLLELLFNASPNNVTIELKCARYTYSNELVGESKKFILIKNNPSFTQNDTHNDNNLNNGLTKTELILVIVFSIIGFLILLILAILFIWCCWFKRRQSKLPNKVKGSNVSQPVSAIKSEDEFVSKLRRESYITINEPVLNLTTPPLSVITSSSSDYMEPVIKTANPSSTKQTDSIIFNNQPNTAVKHSTNHYEEINEFTIL